MVGLTLSIFHCFTTNNKVCLIVLFFQPIYQICPSHRSVGSFRPLTRSLCNNGCEAFLPSSSLWHEWTLCAQKGLFVRCVLSLPAPGPDTCVDLACQPSLLEEPHIGASGLLRMAEVHSIPSSPSPSLGSLFSLQGSWPPSPRRPSDFALLLFLNVRIMRRTDILHYTMMINCFILHSTYWGFGVVQWWPFLRLRQWNCAVMTNYFILPWFLAICITSVMTMPLYLSNSLLHVLFCFR